LTTKWEKYSNSSYIFENKYQLRLWNNPIQSIGKQTKDNSMKRTILLFLLFSLTTSIFPQETTKALTESEIVRKVSYIDIEGKIFEDVKVTLKSSDIFEEYVKVTIVGMDGKRIWKKTLKNAFLYVFSSGQIQVGKPNFDRILIFKNDSGSYTGKIREKEGIY